jgi:hypothetical protein
MCIFGVADTIDARKIAGVQQADPQFFKTSSKVVFNFMHHSKFLLFTHPGPPF